MNQKLNIQKKKNIRRDQVKKTDGLSKTVLEKLSIPLFVIDNQLKIVYCNKALEDLVKLEKKDILKKSIFETPSTWLNEVIKEEDFKTVFETGKQIQRMCVSGAQKRERFFEIQIRPITEGTTPIEKVLTVLIDITDLVKNEVKLKTEINDLRYFDDMRKNLIANVSHELRTPITVSLSGIELIKLEDNTERRNELLDILLNNLHRQNRIIDDLVDISNIKRGTIKLNVEDVDLETILIKVKNEIEFVALKKNIKITTDIQKNLPKIRFDFDELKHILYNLLDNAIKFNKDEGKVTIEASKEGDFIKVCVADTGIGIDIEKLERIFERFYQIDSRTTRKYSGTGMGLAIVNELVAAYGGKVWVESEPGKWTRVFFTIPL